jgi:hypothetical protein
VLARNCAVQADTKGENSMTPQISNTGATGVDLRNLVVKKLVVKTAKSKMRNAKINAKLET